MLQEEKQEKKKIILKLRTNGDELSFTGKRIIASENLMFQQEVIMAPKYYKLAYGKIDKLGTLWDHPPTYMKNGKNPLQKS